MDPAAKRMLNKVPEVDAKLTRATLGFDLYAVLCWGRLPAT